MDGHIDILEPRLISGWAFNPADPRQAVEVDLFVDDRLVASTTAEQYRADLRAAGIGDGWKAFYFYPGSFLSSGLNRVRVAFTDTGQTLQNGEGTISADSDVPPDRDCLRAPSQEALPATNEPIVPIQVSIWMRISSPDPHRLRRSIASARRQSYPQWNLWLQIAGSCPDDLLDELQQLAAKDPRISLTRVEGRTALAHLASRPEQGYVLLLSQRDELPDRALERLTGHVHRQKFPDAVYADHDDRSAAGMRLRAHHKPDWSPMFFIGSACCHGMFAIRNDLAISIASTLFSDSPIASYEVLLALIAGRKRIHHIPEILYHRGYPAGEPFLGSNDSGHLSLLQVSAAQQLLNQMAPGVTISPHPSRPGRFRFTSREEKAKVSIIILTRDSPVLIERCLQSIFDRTSYRNFEVLVVDNGTTDLRALQIIDAYPLRCIRDGRPFNYSRFNNQAAAQATGDVLVFLNNDTQVVTNDWLQIMLGHLRLPQVSVVGPQLLYEDGRIQHAGMALGLCGPSGHVMQHFAPGDDGHDGSLACSREVTAVTGACLMIRSQTYASLQGMDEHYRLVYQDVDLCLRARQLGGSVVYVSNVTLYHHERATRGDQHDLQDEARFIRQWALEIAQGDRYYNRNFTLNRSDYTARYLAPQAHGLPSENPG